MIRSTALRTRSGLRLGGYRAWDEQLLGTAAVRAGLDTVDLRAALDSRQDYRPKQLSCHPFRASACTLTTCVCRRAAIAAERGTWDAFLKLAAGSWEKHTQSIARLRFTPPSSLLGIAIDFAMTTSSASGVVPTDDLIRDEAGSEICGPLANVAAPP